MANPPAMAASLAGLNWTKTDAVTEPWLAASPTHKIMGAFKVVFFAVVLCRWIWDVQPKQL